MKAFVNTSIFRRYVEFQNKEGKELIFRNEGEGVWSRYIWQKNEFFCVEQVKVKGEATPRKLWNAVLKKRGLLRRDRGNLTSGAIR